MKIVIALLALLAVVYASDIDLTSADFQSTIDSNDYVLVMFYAPWCGHCKALKPHFTEAAEKSEGKYVLAKVDCTDDEAKSLCEQHQVRGYPTVVFYKKQVKQEYTGPRTADGILGWLEKKTGPVSTTLEEGGVEAFSKDGGAVVGYFSEEGNESHKQFIAAAEHADVEEFKFGQVFGSSKADGSVTFFRGADIGEDMETTSGDNLAQWVFENSFKLVDEVGGHNFSRYAKLGQPLYLAFTEADTQEEVISTLTKLAPSVPTEKFSWIDAKKYAAQVKGMGASGNVLPCIIRLASFGRNNKPIVFEGEWSEDNVSQWLSGIKDGSVTYTPKSEEVPEDNDGPVTVVVGKTFESIVNDASKDVLVEFYAPWCGHCKKLAPEWDQLGEDFKDDSNIVIAKIDATANDFEAHYEVKGFPTLLLFKSNDKTNPVVYQGARTSAAIGDWLKEQATVEFGQGGGHEEL